MDASRTHRIALLGAGRIGKVHGLNIHQHPETIVQYVVDPHTDSAQSLAQQIGASVVEPDEVFADDSIDAIVICSATPTHSELIERGMLAGKAVFCEKPIDLSIDRVNQVIETTRDCESPLFVAFNRRFDPAVASMKERIQTGDIGDVELIYHHFQRSRAAADRLCKSIRWFVSRHDHS